ncbi:MAG: CpaF family protein [Limnohabitans sp.]|nr:CpaF family protein [Limnohabitans sp.]
MLAEMDLRRLEGIPLDLLKRELKSLAERLISAKNVPVNEAELRQIVQGIQNEILGLGPIEPLLADNSVSDILVNGPHRIYVERRGRIEPSAVSFDDDVHLMRVIERIVSRVGRRIDEMSPMVDARLPDGSRVNAVIPPLAIDGPQLSIRRFSVVPYTMVDLLQLEALTSPMADFIQSLVQARVNLMVSGGTGSGKTTLLNVMSAYVPAHERVVTIEDAAELQLQQHHVVRMESRPPNIEGKGGITQRALLRNSLRMRPDRIIVGEVRGAEVLDMLQAMNTGHEGSMTTLHANSPRDAVTRLEHMLGMAGVRADVRTLRQQISAALSFVIQVSRLSDGRRKVVSVQEIVGMEGDVLTMQEIFKFEQSGLSASGQVHGQFVATGIRPRVMDRLKSRGITLPANMFDPMQVQAA